MFSNVDWRDVLVRAAKTFFQAFFGAIIVGLAAVDDFESLWALVIAAAAAGVSAVWNTVVGVAKKKQYNPNV